MEQINIRWLGHTGLIVKQCVPKGTSIEERFTNLLEVSTAKGEYVVTAPHLGRVAWIRRPGVVMRGEVVARMWAELPEPPGAVSDWQPVKVYAQPTQAPPVPYALNTHKLPKSYRLGEGEIVYIGEEAEKWDLDKGEMMRAIVYNWGTRTHEEQAEAVRRFQEAMKGVDNGETMQA